MIDVVYPYKKGYFDEEELRFSIRSIERNIGIGQLFIIGDRPEFLSDKAIHIPTKSRANKWDDILPKYQLAIHDERVSDNFIWCNDDFFIIDKLIGIPYYKNGSIKEWKRKLIREGSPGTVKRSIKLLDSIFPEGDWFEVHFPIVYNKNGLAEVIRQYELDKISPAHIRTFYCNHFKIDGETTEDYKIHHPAQIDYIHKPFFSTIDLMAQHISIKTFLNNKLNKPSSYETVKVK